MFIFTTKGFEDKCPVCKFKMSDFISVQRVGCPFCYLFLEKPLRNLIVSVQDKSEEHYGKRPSRPNLLYEFFCYALDEESKENPENKDNCDDLKSILEPYF